MLRYSGGCFISSTERRTASDCLNSWVIQANLRLRGVKWSLRNTMTNTIIPQGIPIAYQIRDLSPQILQRYRFYTAEYGLSDNSPGDERAARTITPL